MQIDRVLQGGTLPEEKYQDGTSVKNVNYLLMHLFRGDIMHVCSVYMGGILIWNDNALGRNPRSHTQFREFIVNTTDLRSQYVLAATNLSFLFLRMPYLPYPRISIFVTVGDVARVVQQNILFSAHGAGWRIEMSCISYFRFPPQSSNSNNNIDSIF